MKSPIRLAAFGFAALCVALSPASARGQCASFTGPTYTQDFNSLANSGTTNVLDPTAASTLGWRLTETGGGARDNEQYGGDNGGSGTGDTYSYGTAATTERALGGLQSGTLIPVFGACITNNSGAALAGPAIGYTGEQWRLGAAGRTDRIDFQFSTDATSLTTGTWIDVNSLDFTAPVVAVVGAKDGNAAANRTVISHTIPGGTLTLGVGQTVWIRWTDFNATGADDGLSVDDFTFGAGAPVNQAIAPSCPASVLVLVGNAGSANISATDPDGVVNAATITTILPVNPGTITLGSLVPAGAAGGTATAVLSVSAMTPVGTYAVTVQWSNADGVPQTATCTTSFQVGSFAVTPINQIQGPGVTTPLLGQTHTTRGIVTGLKNNGFFLQTPDASIDANALTSEGIFVFTGGAPPAGAVKGADVLVTGTVTEFQPDPGKPPLTEIGQPGFVFQGVFSTGNPLPAAVVITAAETQVNSLENLERREGMRVSIPSLTVISPTEGNKSEANATSTSNGLFYGVVTGVARSFREPGVENNDPLPAGSPATVTRFDGNPERINVDSDRQAGAPILNVNAGAVVTGIVGPLDYSFGAWTVYPDPVPAAIIASNPVPTAAPAPTRLEFTIGAYNMERFYDTVNDPNGDAVLTAPAFELRLVKASLAIRNFLRFPDILAVVEMEKLSVLQTLATRLSTDALANGQPDPLYQAFLVEGNDVGGIDVGFLVKGALASADPACAPAAAGTKVDVVDVVQLGAATTWIDPSDNSMALLNDRPPLVLRATVHGCTGGTYPVTVIANHLRSLIGVDDETPSGFTTTGNRVRQKRKAQAEFLASIVQARQTAGERVLVVGDFNAYEFSDGLIDVTGTVAGNPVPASQVVVASADLVNPDLVNLVGTSPATERYSYVFEGSAQTIDHVLASTTLTSSILAYRLEHPRIDADFAEVLRGDNTTPARLSDHDPVVAYFTLGAAPTMTAGAAVNRVQGESATSTIATVNDTDSGPGSVTVTVVPGGTATGITLTSIVNTAGTVTATVAATCTATSGTVRLRATDAQGFFVETNLNIVVALNVLDATLTLPPPACANTSVMASVPNNGAGATYVWVVTNGVITAGQGTNAITFTTGAAGSTNVAVTVGRFTCSASASGSVSTTSLVPPTILGVQFSGSIAPTNICQGAPFTLQATAGYTTYQWYLNGNPIMGATASTYSVASATPGNSGSYTVTGAVAGCVSGQSAPFTIGVGPCAPPTITSLTKSCANVTGGLAITINGTGFQQGATVTLAGVAATVNSVTPTAIAVTTGSKAASPAVTGNVVVTNPDTQSATLTNGFTYAVRGDANNNGALTAADASFLRIAIFLGGAQPATLCNGDANSNGAITAADSFFLNQFIFLGGVPPGP